MLKATYDTNILVSGFTISQGSVAFVMNAWLNDEVDMITSAPLIDELARTFEKSYFSTRLTEKQRQSLIALVRDRTTIVPVIPPLPTVATHPEDNFVLATAESGKASYIVTGDHGLLSLRQFNGIQIVNSRSFSGILKSGNPEL